MPPQPWLKTLTTIHHYGWIGVDVFFVISSYLFFHLFRAERDRRGSISVEMFYVRRLLRLYPLMIAFPAAMLLLYGDPQNMQAGLARLLALSTFTENFILLFSPQPSIHFTSHLWTLSFEYQVYLFIPFLFLAYDRWGERTFLKFLLGLWLFCLTARAAFVLLPARPGTIYVNPVLRPESILIGIALSIAPPAVPKWLALAGVAAILGITVNMPNVITPGWWLLGLYPCVALVGAGLVYLALYWRPLRLFLSLRPLVYLGRISFGLYVFHLFALSYVINTYSRLGIGFEGAQLNYALQYLSVVVTTIVVAAASYELFEKPLLRCKDKFAVVFPRAV
jgi:peptidoglycan/LPS O-acetylase OafA/YrhL